MSTSSRGGRNIFAPLSPGFLKNISSNNTPDHVHGNMNNKAKHNTVSPTDKSVLKKFKVNDLPSINHPTAMDIQISTNENISNYTSDNITISQQTLSTSPTNVHDCFSESVTITNLNLSQGSNSTNTKTDVHLNNKIAINISQQKFLPHYVGPILILVECTDPRKNLGNCILLRQPDSFLTTSLVSLI